ncbi:ankyrin repeat domain-containing protein [Campylobacter geochelonis]|uniref:ankyrin repeat domain-containing protein n=1 Tax=Campylobacter geochelonis TaxID=1780362 RepID=UPI00155DAEF0|nr:ankyrin repeat domain-containing protein [Campylobacter geochelonis]QKF71151.1 ankyrin domain-containing protein [Campylobacter geochelonis]
MNQTSKNFIITIAVIFITILAYLYKTNQLPNLTNQTNFTITSDTNVSAIPGLSKYVTQEEVDEFGFTYWDIDNNYTKWIDPLLLPLRSALKDKNTTKVLSYLKEHNLSVDVKIEDGTTPLMYSSFYDDINTTKELIKLGANIHQKDKYKLSPLAYAIEHNSTKTAKLLVDNGAKFEDVKVVQIYLQSPMIEKIIIDNDNINILYDANASRKSKISDGKSPHNTFFYIVMNGFTEIAELALKSGYIPNCTQNNIYDELCYKELTNIPNYEPMLELMLKYNVPGQPTKEQLKEAYDECYEFYYDKCFYDYKNQCNPVFEIYPEIYALKNKYKMFKRYCPDKNGTFKDTKEFINYKNAKNRSYSISSIIASDMKNVFIKDKNITLENLMIDTYKKSTNENEKDFLKTYYLKNYKNDF